MKKVLIGLDLDGVILDHTPHKIELAKTKGIELTPQDTPSDIMEKKFKPAVYHELQQALYNSTTRARQVPLIVGAKKGIHYLHSTGVPFVLISRRKDPEYALLSLTTHGLWPGFFNETNALFVKEKKDKDTEAARLGVTHFIDDEPSVIAELTTIPQTFLFDPLRAYPKSPAGSAHIHSWEELLMHIENEK